MKTSISIAEARPLTAGEAPWDTGAIPCNANEVPCEVLLRQSTPSSPDALSEICMAKEKDLIYSTDLDSEVKTEPACIRRWERTIATRACKAVA